MARRSPLPSDEEDAVAAETEFGELANALSGQIGMLRKAVLRQGHTQELFQARVEEAIGRLAATGNSQQPPGPSSAQVRALLELDQAVLQLLRLAESERLAATAEAAETQHDAPRSLREGLALLQIRVRNLQHSMGLAAIPTRDLAFDDRCHEVCGVVQRPDLPDGWVVEEILPGYRLGQRVLRPARVVVNRRA